MTAPGGGFFKAITSLANIEDRLRRSLGLVGEVGTSFRPDIIPVVIADDATRPGMSTTRNRRFTVTLDCASAVVASQTIKALAPVIIDRIHVAGVTAGVQVEICQLPPDQPDPYVIATTAGTFIDNVLQQSERPPINSAVAVQPLSIVGVIAYSFRHQANSFNTIETEWHLPTGARIHLRFQNAGPATYEQITFVGRTF